MTLIAYATCLGTVSPSRAAALHRPPSAREAVTPWYFLLLKSVRRIAPLLFAAPPLTLPPGMYGSLRDAF